MPTNDEFYIGWSPKAPTGIAKYTRRVVFLLIAFVVAGSILLSLQQKKFSTAIFEFGQLTEIKGIYHQFPVPSLKVLSAQDVFGNATYITIPLVGYGKHGAEGVIDQLEKERGTSLDNRHVILKGTLLYSDGKALLQVDKNDAPLVAIGGGNDTIPGIKELGQLQLTGEVLDPKCYFGVMKPGHGKPHRDCAIRCIAGGMSPVFWVHNEKGETNYFLILDENGSKMNDFLQDHVAEPISLTARAVQYNDWVILYTDVKSIKRTGAASWFKTHDKAISCGPENN
jgi:hypothetical protein